MAPFLCKASLLAQASPNVADRKGGPNGDLVIDEGKSGSMEVMGRYLPWDL